MAPSVLPSDVLVVIFQQLRPCEMLDAAATARDWAAASDSPAVWRDVVRTAVDRAVRSALRTAGEPGGVDAATVSSVAATVRSAVRTAGEPGGVDATVYSSVAATVSSVAATVSLVAAACDARALAFAGCPRADKARAWHVLVSSLAPLTAAAVAKRHPARCVVSLDRRVYDCTRFVMDGEPYAHPGAAANLRREHGKDVGAFFDVFPPMWKSNTAWHGPEK